jgi:hypothetical protein
LATQQRPKIGKKYVYHLATLTLTTNDLLTIKLNWTAKETAIHQNIGLHLFYCPIWHNGL